MYHSVCYISFFNVSKKKRDREVKKMQQLYTRQTGSHIINSKYVIVQNA